MDEQELRDRAQESIRAKAGFVTHLTTYVLVNAMLVVIWAVAGGGVFWPIYPILGWGIGLALHAWWAYGQRQPSEDRIQREMDRLR